MSSIFNKKDLFTTGQKERILTAIRSMEKQTSGEIRVFVERKNPLVDPVERASQVFRKLKMEQTRQRNAVLLYIATKHHELALFGDEGIHKAVGDQYWKSAVEKILKHFKGDDIAESIVKSIHEVGQTLKEKFPHDASSDVNELPGEITFGG